MMKRILPVLVLFLVSVGASSAQNTTDNTPEKESVFRFYDKSNTFIFPGDGNETTFQQVVAFIEAHKTMIDDGSMPIYVYGYCGQGGTESKRAARVRIMSSRVKSELIYAKKATEQNFITKNSTEPFSSEMPNAVVLKFVLPKAKTAEVAPQKQETPVVAKEEPTPPVQQETVQTQPKQEVVVEEVVTVVETAKAPSRWYIGAGGGVAFGHATFVSFAVDGTRPGFTVGAFGGYKISPLLSAELSLDYTRMTLGAYDCCQHLWLASDGNRYYAPLAGATNHQYKDLRSTTNLIGLGGHLNIDLVSIWNRDSRWSALVSPALYGLYSSADVKLISGGQSVKSQSTFHFGAGVDLGVGYQLTPAVGLRLKSGINLVTGKSIDALPKEEHKLNYIWNTALQVTFKL